MQPTALTCQHCTGRLYLQRTWRRVVLRCRGCGAEYGLDRFSAELDDVIEAMLARVPCDRI